MSATWELIRNADAQAPPQPAKSKSQGVGPGDLSFNTLHWCFRGTLTFEKHDFLVPCLVYLQEGPQRNRLLKELLPIPSKILDL